MKRSPRTINQINSFCQRNLIAKHYQNFRDNENKLPPAWRQEVSGSGLIKGLQRKTLRSNCIYGNLLRSVAYYSGIPIHEYNFERDHLTFQLDSLYRVSIDCDGVTIQSELPFSKIGDRYKGRTFFKEYLKGNVPFQREALLQVVERYNKRFFFPEKTQLAIIQRRFNLSKDQAIKRFK